MSYGHCPSLVNTQPAQYVIDILYQIEDAGREKRKTIINGALVLLVKTDVDRISISFPFHEATLVLALQRDVY